MSEMVILFRWWTMETIKHCHIFCNVFWGYILKQNMTIMHFKKKISWISWVKSLKTKRPNSVLRKTMPTECRQY
jgi:hypothetical protein